MQSVGDAAASAGTHAGEGYVRDPDTGTRHLYTSCVDLSWSLASRAFLDSLVVAGFVPFFRDVGSFANNKHIHAIDEALLDERGRQRMLPSVRNQVKDAIMGRNGLVNHGPMPARWALTPAQRMAIKARYDSWAPSVATRVLAPEGNQIVCYAWYEGGTVRADVGLWARYWSLTFDPKANVLRSRSKVYPLAAADVRFEGLTCYRAKVRGLAEALGLKASFRQTIDRVTYDVALSY